MNTTPCSPVTEKEPLTRKGFCIGVEYAGNRIISQHSFKREYPSCEDSSGICPQCLEVAMVIKKYERLF